MSQFPICAWLVEYGVGIRCRRFCRPIWILWCCRPSLWRVRRCSRSRYSSLSLNVLYCAEISAIIGIFALSQNNSYSVVNRSCCRWDKGWFLLSCRLYAWFWVSRVLRRWTACLCRLRTVLFCRSLNLGISKRTFLNNSFIDFHFFGERNLLFSFSLDCNFNRDDYFAFLIACRSWRLRNVYGLGMSVVLAESQTRSLLPIPAARMPPLSENRHLFT